MSRSHTLLDYFKQGSSSSTASRPRARIDAQEKPTQFRPRLRTTKDAASKGTGSNVSAGSTAGRCPDKVATDGKVVDLTVGRKRLPATETKKGIN